MTEPWATPPMTTVEALDAAFAGHACELVRPDGRRHPLRLDRWSSDASASDLALFVDRCSGPTLDVGCGPGRLTGALWARGVNVLGVDISTEAVRQTLGRGAPALCQSIFDDLPGTRFWQHAVLADGNIGLGGDPLRLLRRVADLVNPGGDILVELNPEGSVRLYPGVRLQVGDRSSQAFDWATVGIDAIADLAAAAGLVMTELMALEGRHVATIRRSALAPGVA